MKKILILTMCLLANVALASMASYVSDFESLAFDGSSEYYNGSDLSGGFAQNGGLVYFTNNYNSTYGSWDSFAYSKVSDSETAGWSNQYAAYPGSGANGSSNYGVFYEPWSSTTAISFNVDTAVAGFDVANTTYAALSMLNGDNFAKKFTQNDWFTLTVTGYDASGAIGNSVTVYLANGTDILDNWEWVDLSSLGANLRSLSFDLNSSDVGAYGMNTPAYFAMDNLTFVPEPISLVLIGFGAMLVRRK